MLNLIQSLIDRCIQLVEHRNKRRQTFFSECVEPVMKTFDEVHASYLKTFTEAREAIVSDPNWLKRPDAFFDSIYADSLLSQSQRAQLLHATKIMDKPELVDFLKAIREYLGVSDDEDVLIALHRVYVSEDGGFGLNPLRTQFTSAMMFSMLRQSSTDPNMLKRTILRDIDEALTRLQQRHSVVKTTYAELRNQFFAA
jgi:hypothetical protein